MFDNADFNVATLNGHNTFHSVGGIACITPPGVVETVPVKRKAKLPSSEMLGSFGHVPIKTYSKPAVPGLQSVVIDSLETHYKELNPSHVTSALDSLWVLDNMY